ncbi:MAG: hypothetical protein KIS78_31185 [Labilithrix sp.]|nr:hypothetical protein [Labilithrix sp.]
MSVRSDAEFSVEVTVDPITIRPALLDEILARRPDPRRPHGDHEMLPYDALCSPTARAQSLGAHEAARAAFCAGVDDSLVGQGVCNAAVRDLYNWRRDVTPSDPNGQTLYVDEGPPANTSVASELIKPLLQTPEEAGCTRGTRPITFTAMQELAPHRYVVSCKAESQHYVVVRNDVPASKLAPVDGTTHTGPLNLRAALRYQPLGLTAPFPRDSTEASRLVMAQASTTKTGTVTETFVFAPVSRPALATPRYDELAKDGVFRILETSGNYAVRSYHDPNPYVGRNDPKVIRSEVRTRMAARGFQEIASDIPPVPAADEAFFAESQGWWLLFRKDQPNGKRIEHRVIGEKTFGPDEASAATRVKTWADEADLVFVNGGRTPSGPTSAPLGDELMGSSRYRVNVQGRRGIWNTDTTCDLERYVWALRESFQPYPAAPSASRSRDWISGADAEFVEQFARAVLGGDTRSWNDYVQSSTVILAPATDKTCRGPISRSSEVYQEGEGSFFCFL